MKKKQKSSWQTVQEYVDAIQNEQWDKLYDLCQITWKEGNIITPRYFKNTYEMLLPINDYKIELQRDSIAACLHRYVVTINDNIKMYVNVICEKAAFKPDINGKWGVNPISTLRRDGQLFALIQTDIIKEALS